MKLRSPADNKLHLPPAVLPVRDAGHNLLAAKSLLSSSHHALSLQVKLALGGTILLLGFDAAKSLYAAPPDGEPFLHTISTPTSTPITQSSSAVMRTAPKTSTATEISTANSGSNAPRTQSFGKPALSKTGRSGANSHVSAIPAGNPYTQQTQDEQLMPAARNSSPLRITRQQNELVEPLLQEAYFAYRNGKLEQAQQLYLAMIRKDMHNYDALLGLAAITLQHGDNVTAAQYYTRVLALDPRNAMANAGLAALSADDGANESHLKLLLRDQNNSAILHFALGNLYARQMRWSEAQQAYSNAYTLDSGNAAFVFNLAVSLDHLGQRDLAALHYQQAVLLDQANNAGLDHAHIAQRLAELLH